MPGQSATDLGPEHGTLVVPAEKPVYARKHFWAGDRGWLYQRPGNTRNDLVPTRRPLQAPCRKAAQHAIPAPGCICGVSASKSDRWWGSGDVAVVVSGWGTTVVHENGYRFEHAKPVAIVDEYDARERSIDLEQIAAMYGLEVWASWEP